MPVKIGFLGFSELGEKQRAEIEREKERKVSVNNGQVNCLDQKKVFNYSLPKYYNKSAGGLEIRLEVSC